MRTFCCFCTSWLSRDKEPLRVASHVRRKHRAVLPITWRRNRLSGTLSISLLFLAMVSGGCASLDPRELTSCLTYAWEGFRPIAADRTERFLGKVQEDTARCRGGETAVAGRPQPWVDWRNYWAAGDAASRAHRWFDWTRILGPNNVGTRGALLDLEYQRMEMIKFNLFDNSGTFEKYVRVLRDPAGIFKDPMVQMRVPVDHPDYTGLKNEGLAIEMDSQMCTGKLIRFRNLKGYCNDIFNPLMGSTDQPFARNVEFEAVTFLDLKDEEKSQETKNRHGNRLQLHRPDPQLISRKLFSRDDPQLISMKLFPLFPRDQKPSVDCNEGRGLLQKLPETASKVFSPQANCAYEKANWFNVLAAFWIQFMTHDWFSHLEEGSNSNETMVTGCVEKQEKDDTAKGIWRYVTLPKSERDALKCRPQDRIGKALFDKNNFSEDEKKYFTDNGEKYLTRAYKTTLNKVTAWWDASQIYGYDSRSQGRVKVKAQPTCVQTEQVNCKVKNLDAAKLDMSYRRKTENTEQGYLHTFDESDGINPAWEGQEATAFPDNWSIGLSFFHNVFAREHNSFVDRFKDQVSATPNEDSGLRDPAHPERNPIHFKDVTPEELFQVARLVVSAEIAKIHTIEWTTQLLYDEPLYEGMNANWFGLLKNYPAISSALETVMRNLKDSGDVTEGNLKYSAFAGGSGIFGLGNEIKDCWHIIFCPDKWSFENPGHVNGGTHHFGSPFNFPEEFITVYRLHTLLPDLLEYREISEPNKIVQMIPIVETFREKATTAMRTAGLAN